MPNQGMIKGEIAIPFGEQSFYKAIDLELSVKWASFNLGASTSTEQGGLYLWGDAANICFSL